MLLGAKISYLFSTLNVDTINRKAKEELLTLTTCAQFAASVTGLWGTSTALTSSLLYRHLNRRGTYGSASGLARKKPHLILRLHLKEHEYEDHEGQAAEFAKGRVLVSVPAFKREGYFLDENSCTEDDDRHDSKLDTDLGEDSPLWLGLVQFWCKIVNKSGNEERKDEAKDTNPRDAHCPNDIM